MKKLYTTITLLLFWGSLFSQADSTSEVYTAIKTADSLLFSVGFNTCDISQFEKLVSDSFEFYHDEAGITSSKKEFIAGIENGLCKLDYKARRELTAGTMEVYVLKKDGKIYGAVQNGQHIFYALEKGKPEYITSRAKFTHLWLLENGVWKLSRGLSYDHQKS